VDGEMNRRELQERVSIMLGSGVVGNEAPFHENLGFLAFQDQECGGDNFVNISCEREEREELISFFKKSGSELVILDNLSVLADIQDENAAHALSPVLDLLRELQRLGMAVLLVHHSRKGNGGDGSYRGSSKLAVTFEAIIRLETDILPNPVEGLGGGVAFRGTFEKSRGRRSEEIAGFSAGLTAGGTWEWAEDEREGLSRIAQTVRSRLYKNQGELAEALGISQATLSRRKKAILAHGLMTSGEWLGCLRDAGEAAEEAGEEPADF
jgi:hypothetical protein